MITVFIREWDNGNIISETTETFSSKEEANDFISKINTYQESDGLGDGVSAWILE